MFEPQEKLLDWTFRRKAKTHFARPGKSSPANNTELLHDGSAEARQIVVEAKSLVMQGEMTSDTFSAAGILASALDYLKGMDLSPERFSYTADFFGPTPETWLAEMVERTPETSSLMQIAPLTVSEDENSHEYPAYSIQNQKPLDEKGSDVCPTGA